MERGIEREDRRKGSPCGTWYGYLDVCMCVYIYIRGRNVGIAAYRIVNAHDHNLLYKTETAGWVVEERFGFFVERLGTILTKVLGCFNIYLIS